MRGRWLSGDEWWRPLPPEASTDALRVVSVPSRGWWRGRSRREDLMRRLRLLSGCVIIGGCALTGAAPAQDGGVLRVALAGTMEQVIRRQIGPAFTAATGYT